MIVLGINDGHDAGICLLRDGEVVLVCNEERRRNVKNYAGVPTESLKVAFERTGIRASDVDVVTLTSLIRTTVPTRAQPATVYKTLTTLYSLGRTDLGTKFGRWLLPRIRKRTDLMAHLAEIGLGDKPVKPYDHHLCHAATAYYHRPWDEPATILTLDGAGDGLCASVNLGQGQSIEVRSQTPKFHSPAAGLYSAVTAYLGMRPSEHEYKVMGMAPYGQAQYTLDAMKSMFTVDGLQFRNHTGKFGVDVSYYLKNKLFQHRFDNICAATQQIFEDLMIQWVRNAIAATGCRNVCAAGGAFLNVKANKLIREMPEVEKLYVYPASDDGGTPVGAAMLGYLDLCREKNVTPKLSPPKSMYQGLEYSDAEMESACRASGLPFRRLADPCDEVGGLLADGKIIARFNGREELGPRALGNRSIMADPRDLRYIRKLNFAIKQRDFWMPFAASILEEDAGKYLKNPTKWAFFMIEAFDSTPEGGDVLVAGSHPFDRTIRPQLVNELNPTYRDTIRAFKKRTGVGGILNTSFNLHGSPIVGTPEIAIETLVNSELDALALGPFLVTKGTSA